MDSLAIDSLIHCAIELHPLSELIEPHLTDFRWQNTQLPLADLLRQSVYSRLLLIRLAKTGHLGCVEPSTTTAGSNLKEPDKQEPSSRIRRRQPTPSGFPQGPTFRLIFGEDLGAWR